MTYMIKESFDFEKAKQWKIVHDYNKIMINIVVFSHQSSLDP